jgi:hypothetical protein
MWIMIGLGVVSVVVIALKSLGHRRNGDSAELGTVSDRWIAENRTGRGGDGLR